MSDFDTEFLAHVERELATDPTDFVRRSLATLKPGTLTLQVAAGFGQLAGVSARTVYRWHAQLIDASPPPPVANDLTPIERMRAGDATAFTFDDDEIMTLLYMCGGNQQMLIRGLTDIGCVLPSTPTVCRRAKLIPPLVRDGAAFGHANRAKKLLYIRNSAEFSDEAWQFDEFHLDIFVRYGPHSKPVRPHALLFIDDHSRFITGATLLPSAMKAVDLTAALGAAVDSHLADDGSGVILQGCPDVLLLDNASPHRADSFVEAITHLNQSVKTHAAYTPMTKGKVERVGQTIQSMVVTGMPGEQTRSKSIDDSHLQHISDEHLLDFDMLAERFFAAVNRYNYELGHSSLRGATPWSVYQNRAIRPAVADDVLANMMLPGGYADGVRKMHPDGIKFDYRFFTDVALSMFVGQNIRMRSWHHRRNRIGVFDGDEFVCMAPDSSHLTKDERELIVGANRSQYKAVTDLARSARAARRKVTEMAELGGTSAADPNNVAIALAAIRANQPLDETAAPAAASSAPKSKRSRSTKASRAGAKPGKSRTAKKTAAADPADSSDVGVTRFAAAHGIDLDTVEAGKEPDDN